MTDNAICNLNYVTYYTLNHDDINLLYEFIYSKKNAMLFFHCKAGKGRSGYFALVAKLFNEWDAVFGGQLSSLNVKAFVQKLEKLYWKIRMKRPIVPYFEQFKHAVQLALHLRKIETTKKSY